LFFDAVEELERLFLFPDELALKLRDFYLAAFDVPAEILKERGLCAQSAGLDRHHSLSSLVTQRPPRVDAGQRGRPECASIRYQKTVAKSFLFTTFAAAGCEKAFRDPGDRVLLQNGPASMTVTRR
jgi:hypothetical protein